MKELWVILVAGGSGRRFGAPVPKQFLPLKGKTVLEHSLQALGSIAGLGGLVLVLPQEKVGEWAERLEGVFSIPLRVVAGGETRQGSVQQGLAAVGEEAQWVAIHDAARPLVTAQILEACLKGAREMGAAVAALPVADTLKQGDAQEQVLQTVPREGLYRIQTPQVFRRELLQEVLAWAQKEGWDATDEATLVERMGKPVRLVAGSEYNFKITRPQDLQLAGTLLAGRETASMNYPFRIGQGYDVHPYVKGRDLILGGVKIPFELGLQGHSDADALLHAVADALLGAAAAGDLGAHFPDSDPKYKGASSLRLLQEVGALLEKKGFRVGNVDATLICQRPKLAPHVPAMRENIARALQISPEQVSVKATTEEGLGFTGQMLGLAAKAIVLIHSGKDKTQEE